MRYLVPNLLLVVVFALEACIARADAATLQQPAMEGICSNEVVAERVPLERSIIEGYCKADVGTCPVGTCDCPRGAPGYICPRTAAIQVDCRPFGERQAQVVRECVCCNAELIVKGIVVVSKSGATLSGMAVKVNGLYTTTTGSSGDYAVNVNPILTEVVVSATDEEGAYADAVKVEDIPSGLAGPITVDLAMVKRGEPITLKYEESIKIPLIGNDDVSASAVMVIHGNSFKSMTGVNYMGIVNARVSFSDVSSGANANEIQGRFLTDAGDQLQSSGMFSADFRDEFGNPLQGQVSLFVQSGIKLWNLDNASGRWKLAPTLKRRRRRDIQLTNELLIDIQNANWVNCDRISTVPKCFYKTRVFYETPSDAANSPSFKPDTLIYTPANQLLQLYNMYTNNPDDVCFEARCMPYDPTDPTNVLVGFISLKSYENINVGGFTIPLVTELTPKSFADYSPGIQIEHNYISYTTPGTGPNDIFVNYKAAVGGGFYHDIAQCESSIISQPAFHFIKPSLPSYESYPGSVKICTARIHFAEEYMFYDILAGLSTLPDVAVISAWNEGGIDYYHVETTTMEFSTAGGDFYYICATYRCSLASEETSVYIDVDVPTVAVTHPVTGVTETVPEFLCSTACDPDIAGGACSSGDVEGAFVAPDVSRPYGPDYYNSTTTDCDFRTKLEDFAFVIHCYKNQQVP